MYIYITYIYMHTIHSPISMHNMHIPSILCLHKTVNHYNFCSKNYTRMKAGTNSSWSSPNIDRFMVLSKIITLKYQEDIPDEFVKILVSRL